MRPQSEAKRQSGSERAERGPPDKGRPPCQRMVTALEMLVVLVVGCCALLVVLVIGLVGILGVLGVTQRLLELAVGSDMDERQEGPEQAPEGEDGV